jgi:hypothetical protein
VATPDSDPWDDDPFARGAVAPPLAAEQPEPEEDERRWEDEEGEANWEPAGAARGGDPWDFPTETAAAEPAEDERRWDEEEEEGDAYGYNPAPQETVEPEPAPEPKPVPEPKPKKLPKYIPAGRLKSDAEVVFPVSIKGNTGAELVSYEWAYQIEDVQTFDDVVAKKVSDWDRADVSSETGQLIVHKFVVKGPDGDTKTVSLETAARLLGYTPAETKGIASIASTAKSYAKLQMALSTIKAAKEVSDRIRTEVNALPVPALIELPKEGIFTVYDVGGMKVTTIAHGASKEELEKRIAQNWRGDIEKQRQQEEGTSDPDGLMSKINELESRAKKLKLKLDIAIRKAGEKKRLEEAVRLERRALRAGITLGEAFGPIRHRCLYLNPMRRPIHESVLSGRGIRVNREAGTINNVKILGLVSENGRQYLPAAIQAAKKLYEGVHVNIDHPKDSPDQQRSAYDRFGKLTRIRWVEGEGLYGDLVYLKTHPMAERICEAAERMPDAFGMSHNAQGEGEENKDGVFVVSKIVEVRHVDLVADPATTKSLSEARIVEADSSDAFVCKIYKDFGGPYGKTGPKTIKEQIIVGSKENAIAWVKNQLKSTSIKDDEQGKDYTIFGVALRKGSGVIVAKYEKSGTGSSIITHAESKIEEASSKDPYSVFKEWSRIYTIARQNAANAHTIEGERAWNKAMDIIARHTDVAEIKATRNPPEMPKSPAEVDGGKYLRIKPTTTGMPESTGATKMDTTEIVSQLKDLLDQLAMSLGGEEEVPSEEAYDGEEEKPAMEAEEKAEEAMDDEATEGYDTPEMDEEPEEKKKPAMEGRQTKAIRNARKLCEAVGLKPSRELLQDLASMPRETAARQVQRLALAQKSKAPRSGSYMTEGRTGNTDNSGIPTGPALFTWLAN